MALTKEAGVERIEKVLREAGIKVKIAGCGCCGSPWLEAVFPDGETVDEDSIRIDTERKDG